MQVLSYYLTTAFKKQESKDIYYLIQYCCTSTTCTIRYNTLYTGRQYLYVPYNTIWSYYLLYDTHSELDLDIINLTHHIRGTLAYIEECTIFTDSFSSNFYHPAQYILCLFLSISAIWNKGNSNVVGSLGNININYSIILSSVNIYRIITSILNISTFFLFLYVQK